MKYLVLISTLFVSLALAQYEYYDDNVIYPCNTFNNNKRGCLNNECRCDFCPSTQLCVYLYQDDKCPDGWIRSNESTKCRITASLGVMIIIFIFGTYVYHAIRYIYR